MQLAVATAAPARRASATFICSLSSPIAIGAATLRKMWDQSALDAFSPMNDARSSSVSAEATDSPTSFMAAVAAAAAFPL